MEQQNNYNKLTWLTLVLLGFAILAVWQTEAAIKNNGDGTITLHYTMSAQDAVKVQNAFARRYGYVNETCGFFDTNELPYCISNPESKAQFTERKIREYIREVVAADNYHDQRNETIGAVN